MNRPLVLIVVAQLFGTSLWFSGNGAAVELKRAWGLENTDIGRLVMNEIHGVTGIKRTVTCLTI